MALFDFFKNKKKAKENKDIQENIQENTKENTENNTQEHPDDNNEENAEEVAQGNTEENTEEVAQGNTEENTEEIAAGNTEENAEEIAAGSTEENAEESDKEISEKSTEVNAEKSIDVNTEESTGESVPKSAEVNTVEDAEESTEKSADESYEEQTSDQNFDDGKEQKKNSFFGKLKAGLSKTKNNMIGRIESVIFQRNKIDEEMMEELEETLILSDISMDTTMKITEQLRKNVKAEKIDTPEGVMEQLKKIITEMIGDDITKHQLCNDTPLVMLMIGVNGSGKTTSIAKLAYMLKQEGKKVMLAAGDTFRAAAIEQLEIWGQRVGVPVIRHQEGADPSAVVFDAISAAKARNIDVLICDTAGRLQNKKNLMNELEKMYKIISKNFPEASKETLLVLDAATGKNAVSQVKEFGSISELTGIVLTKLDGTAKGGIVITISDEFDIPVKFIGVGEGMEDLQQFNPTWFADALFDKQA